MEDELDLGTASFTSISAKSKTYAALPPSPRSPKLQNRIVSAPSSPASFKARSVPKTRRTIQELQLSSLPTDLRDTVSESGSPLKTPTGSPRQFDSQKTPTKDDFGISITENRPSLRRAHSGSSLKKKSIERMRRNTLTRSVDFPSAPMTEDRLRAFRRFCICFCLVQFDIDKGPDLDNCYPSYPFTTNERLDIAFSSFPDTSASTSTSDSTVLTFNWRIPKEHKKSSNASSSTYKDHSYYYGYCSFLQQKNDKLKRNYLQRSLVIITERPEMHGLFMTLADQLSTLHTKSENQAAIMVEIACSNISHWPDFRPGALQELNFLGQLITIDVPIDLDQPQAHDARSQASPRIPRHAVLASVPLLPLSLLFQDALTSLWLLWELCILAEPILVYSPSDVVKCSQIVTWLQALTKPLTSSKDYRPFYHVHASDFTAIINSATPRRGLAIGCTNPLLFSGCRHWQHIYKCHNKNADGGVFGTTSNSKCSPSFKDAVDATRSGLFSERKRIIRRDEDIVHVVQGLIKSGDFLAADALLIRHFASQSEKLLVPLNRYFASLKPSSLDPFSKPLPMQPFSSKDFLAHLSEHDTPLKFRKSKLPGSHSTNASAALPFYREFIGSPAFANWLYSRSHSTDDVAQKRYLASLQNVDMEQFVRSKSRQQVSSLLDNLVEAISDIDVDTPLVSPTRTERKVQLQRQAQRLRQLRDSESDFST